MCIYVGMCVCTFVGVIGFAHVLNAANLHMCVHEKTRERVREGKKQKSV